MTIRIASTILLGCVLAVSPSRAQSPEERTKQALDLVMHRKYEAFYAMFSPEMKKAISLQDYASQIDQLMAMLGKPASQEPAATRQVQDSAVVAIPVHWSAATLNFIVSWNKDSQVVGTWFLKPDAPAHPQYKTAGYSKPARFSAREITIGDDEWKLPGTLAVPKGGGPFPAIVLVHGSGPQDRDETIGGAKVFPTWPKDSRRAASPSCATTNALSSTPQNAPRTAASR